MASGKGTTLGAAVADLLKGRSRTPGRKVAYLVSPKTGATPLSVAKQLGVQTRTLKNWLSGATKPSPASQAKIDKLYGNFWSSNNRGVTRSSLRIRETTGAMTVERGNGRVEVLKSLLIEKDRRRGWSGVVSGRTSDEVQEAFIEGVVAKSPLEQALEYLNFNPGNYTIETV